MFDEYKVIAIPNPQTILIDFGLNDGAQRGDTLRVITKGSNLIINDINYGSYDTIKAVIEITTPFEKFSECKVFSYTTVNVLSPLQSLLQQTRKSETSLKGVTPTAIPAPPPRTPIQVGDIVQFTNEKA
ncbi:hypothetical protein H6A02_01615 [Veillonella magna]|uniref:hypothetical protein n=1 Tax=Veillonella magna TaxID=464322 RepID=UPI0019609BCD|nr:hypothetical protein [Veillonella magna]MBM6823683.1 hypothetical protein [Veillonella magna]